MNITKRLTVTRINDENFPFVVESEYESTTGTWNVMSRFNARTFPMIVVNRVAGRADYRIIVRVSKEAR